MRDTAIRNTHPTVVSINGDSDARDAQGHPVLLDEAKIAAEISKLQAAHAATQYRRDRATAYPPIGDQLDAMWKGGAAEAAMLEIVLAVKAKYPKP